MSSNYEPTGSEFYAPSEQVVAQEEVNKIGTSRWRVSYKGTPMLMTMQELEEMADLLDEVLDYIEQAS